MSFGYTIERKAQAQSAKGMANELQAVNLLEVSIAVSYTHLILELRERIGHMPLWLIGVTGYVRRDDGLVLLEQRTDNGKWTLVTGINEPGEEPADTVAREAKEETGVDVIVTDLVSVKSDRRMITLSLIHI